MAVESNLGMEYSNYNTLHQAGTETGDYITENWDSLTRKEKILYFLGFVRALARRLQHKLPENVELDDLISAGNLGLINAVDKFDPRKNVKFRVYAEFRIKGSMLDELRTFDWVPRSLRRKAAMIRETYRQLEAKLKRPATDEEVAEYLDISLEDFSKMLNQINYSIPLKLEAIGGQDSNDDGSLSIFDVLEDLSTPDPVELIDLKESSEKLEKIVSELPEKERLVINLYYRQSLTMKEIGNLLNLTESRISQIHSKTIKKIRARLGRTCKGKICSSM